MNELWAPSLVLVWLVIGLGMALVASIIMAVVTSVRETKERERRWRG